MRFSLKLSISSGKEGRQRMLYSVPNDKIALMPNKATIKIGVPSFEILFRSRQGALMGLIQRQKGISRHDTVALNSLKPRQRCLSGFTTPLKRLTRPKYRKPVTSGLITQHINISYEEGSKYQQEETVNEARFTSNIYQLSVQSITKNGLL